jgi:phosphoglycolate phosphatase-like HAD superfamily hydrolase
VRVQLARERGAAAAGRAEGVGEGLVRGLRAAGYRFDEDAYWRYIRDADSLRLLRPEPGARALVERLVSSGVRCYVVTNCREQEAREALEALDIPPELFDGGRAQNLSA